VGGRAKPGHDTAAMTAAFTLRDATPGDAAEVLRLVRGLAEYEELLHQVTATAADIANLLSGPRHFARAALAEAAGRAVGVVFWYHTASTFTGALGVYVEDVFVEPEYRGKGIGLALFRHVARAALAEDCVCMEWRVLTWNQPSIDFYHKLGAKQLTDWHTMDLRGPALAKLGAPNG
jgi:GNAT superfamily N-acetyltransferase